RPKQRTGDADSPKALLARSAHWQSKITTNVGIVLVPELRKDLFACLALSASSADLDRSTPWGRGLLQASSLPKQNVIASFLEGGRHETQGVHQPCRWCGDSVAADCAGADSEGGPVRYQCRSDHRRVHRQLRSKERSPDRR